MLTKYTIPIVFIVFLLSACSLSLDPFSIPPKGTSPNCGPENRYKFNVTIDSKAEFVDFIQKNEIKWVKLSDFKNPNGEIDWQMVLGAVQQERVFGGRTIYSLNFTPYSDCPSKGHTLKMSNDGQVSVYGCCGK